MSVAPGDAPPEPASVRSCAQHRNKKRNCQRQKGYFGATPSLSAYNRSAGTREMDGRVRYTVSRICHGNREMAFAFNGIGTKYYGEADRGLDGSYTTTEWIVILWLPLLPLRSVRVTGQKGANYDGVGSLQW